MDTSIGDSLVIIKPAARSCPGVSILTSNVFLKYSRSWLFNISLILKDDLNEPDIIFSFTLSNVKLNPLFARLYALFINLRLNTCCISESKMEIVEFSVSYTSIMSIFLNSRIKARSDTCNFLYTSTITSNNWVSYNVFSSLTVNS